MIPDWQSTSVFCISSFCGRFWLLHLRLSPRAPNQGLRTYRSIGNVYSRLWDFSGACIQP